MDSSGTTRSSIESDVTLDPLSYVIRPSPTETPAERLVRIRHETEAKAISDTIDEELQKQAIAERKELKAVKILLLGTSNLLDIVRHVIQFFGLGQSESGVFVFDTLQIKSLRFSRKINNAEKYVVLVLSLPQR